MPIRKTRTSTLVLTTMTSEDPSLTREWYAYDLSKRTGVQRPTISLMLQRWANEGLLLWRWEDREAVQGRAVRRLYRFNPDAPVDPRSLLKG
jgi:hypothetical protein